MRAFDYQRQVIAYHGCDASVRDSVILHGGKLKISQNDYDWLGRGIYFWEHCPARALEWAKQQQKRGQIDKPAVLGAVLHLGQCFDLLDFEYTSMLKASYPTFCDSLLTGGKAIPENARAHAKDDEKVLRKLDRAVIEWNIERLEDQYHTKFHSVRGMFQEGRAVFPGSEIRLRSHIQIAVREPACVQGYFLPSSE
jgi:hypothetical protein